MKYLHDFVEEFKQNSNTSSKHKTKIELEILRVKDILLDSEFKPSNQLRALFDKLLRRSRYPLEVAIVGQFSSGKSTFLNALLSKSILPTGITPVTSKVNFLNYYEEYKLKVTYNDGSSMFHNIEDISKFTDQRVEVDDVKYLSVYAPLEILKDISFVDTPGLNSQSYKDTQTTQNILRDVDGIIWLSLLDNAGKKSEKEILEKYLSGFSDKSLCVLNQKDRFTDKEVEQTKTYIEQNFSQYFKQVTPISASYALKARSNKKDVLIEDNIKRLQKEFIDQSSSAQDNFNLQSFEESFKNFTTSITQVKSIDENENIKLLKDSNIEEVLNFINKDIKHKAIASKELAIKKDLKNICTILIDEYQSIVSVYETLILNLNANNDKVLKAYDDLYIKHSNSLFIIEDRLSEVLENIVTSISKNTSKYQKKYYLKEKNILKLENIKEYEFTSIEIDKDKILQELFYDNNTVDKKVKSTILFFKNLDEQSRDDFLSVYHITKQTVQEWQKPFLHIKKTREIGSDDEFYNVRVEIAKIYENILIDYYRATTHRLSDLHSKYTFFESHISLNYRIFTQESILYFKEKIIELENINIKNKNTKNINPIETQEILEKLKKSFSYDKIEVLIVARRNYLFKTIEQSKEEYININNSKLEFLNKTSQSYKEKIDMIANLKESI